MLVILKLLLLPTQEEKSCVADLLDLRYSKNSNNIFK